MKANMKNPFARYEKAADARADPLRCHSFACIVILAAAIFSGCSAKPTDAVLTSKDCWIDTINGKADNLVPVERGTLEISGWAADNTSGRAPEKRVIQVLDARGNLAIAQIAQERSERMDVANTLGQPGYKGAGFKVVIAGNALGPGQYGLSIAMFRDGATVLCASSKQIVVK